VIQKKRGVLFSIYCYAKGEEKSRGNTRDILPPTTKQGTKVGPHDGRVDLGNRWRRKNSMEKQHADALLFFYRLERVGKEGRMKKRERKIWGLRPRGWGDPFPKGKGDPKRGN